jgi:hypothetical protein
LPPGAPPRDWDAAAADAGAASAAVAAVTTARAVAKALLRGDDGFFMRVS